MTSCVSNLTKIFLDIKICLLHKIVLLLHCVKKKTVHFRCDEGIHWADASASANAIESN